ncbi:MAG: aminoacyl-histidine dipeptidase [Prevotellaceae bacterium]|jgi:dipeptidase D|nr:aminoacyl-histidine dipeptidase [Prevotellaceae bacterium]
MTKQELQPAGIFKYFGDICLIPHASKHEKEIIHFLKSFAAEHGLPIKCDAAGNVLISKPASKGMENRPTIVLQSHLDMVCEKNSSSNHNFDTDPIDWYIADDGWIKAKDTTLGADCGIGIAAQLALLVDKSLVHGPIECLFTIDEETGLTGAKALESGFMTGNILINLDSEDEGELFIGCAGGVDIVGTFDYTTEPLPEGYALFQYTVSGLIGGHSGDDINRGRGNAVKIATRFLWQTQQACNIRIGKFTGGNLRNAIAREASALIAVDKSQIAALTQLFEKHQAEIKIELSFSDVGIQQTLAETPRTTDICLIDQATQTRLLHCLQACPHGVIAMSHTMPGLVETSTNLASVKFVENNRILVGTSQRSSVENAKYNIAHTVDAVFRLARAELKYGDGYPGWAPNVNSPILALTKSAYQRLFHTEPEVKAIHAGLECGLFLEKYPQLDMISFGPTIKNAHSPDEKLDIQSVEKFWLLLLEVLRGVKS